MGVPSAEWNVHCAAPAAAPPFSRLPRGHRGPGSIIEGGVTELGGQRGLQLGLGGLFELGILAKELLHLIRRALLHRRGFGDAVVQGAQPPEGALEGL